ncbi:MAG: cytochrome [Frankiales bacterium]|nr:cytochrome [Frankiales bacterium]
MSGVTIAVGQSAREVVPAELDAAPHQHWAELRENRPVACAPALGLTLLTRHEAVRAVCEDETRFSAETPDGPLTRTLGPNFMHSDGELHLAVRRALAPALRGGTVRSQHESWMRKRTRQLLGELADGGDVMAGLAFPLAAEAVSRISGVLASPSQWQQWFEGLAAGVGNFEDDPVKRDSAEACSDQIGEAVTRAARADAGLVGVLTRAGFPAAVVLSTVKLLVIGGVQEPRDLSGFAVWGLVGSRQWADVAADRSLLPAAIEEAARWGSPVGTVTRTTTRDVRLDGVTLPAGTAVGAVLASANRDPRRWTDPDRYDARRDEGSHLAYGAGPHLCIGAAMARVLVRVLLDEMLDIRPGLSLANTPVATGWEFCTPGAVEVTG